MLLDGIRLKLSNDKMKHLSVMLDADGKILTKKKNERINFKLKIKQEIQ